MISAILFLKLCDVIHIIFIKVNIAFFSQMYSTASHLHNQAIKCFFFLNFFFLLLNRNAFCQLSLI
jgi:hypothetical protein